MTKAIENGRAYHSFTVTEYYQMAKVGILPSNARVELLAGKIIDMSPIGRFHTVCVNRLTELFVKQLDTDRFFMSIQNPVRLDNRNEPEPDIAILHKNKNYSKMKIPAGGDVFLLIEVADTTLKFDLNTKVPLYAQYNIPEVWVVDIRGEQLHIYSHPRNGQYQRHAIFSNSEQLTTNLPFIIKANDVLLSGLEEE